MTPTTLARFKELTDRLPPFPSKLENGGAWMAYRVLSGTCHARALHTVPGLGSNALWIISAGAEVPEHSHEEREVLIVLQGETHLRVGGTTHVLKDGDMLVIEPGTLHSATYPVRTLFYAITCPDSKDWP